MKQVILMRTDLGMSPGKMVAQACHAVYPDGHKKVALEVSSEKELLELLDKGKLTGIPTIFIQDAGHTEVPPGTITCGRIGPGADDLIDNITGHLKLL